MIVDVLATDSLGCEQKQEMMRLAQSHGEGWDQYVQQRFCSYSQVLCAMSSAGLRAFQMLHSFERAGESYIYFGPLFSKQNAYFTMFAYYFQKIQNDNPEKTIHLLAEIQNPRVLLVFKSLFWETSYPLVDRRSKVPKACQDIVEIFAEELNHIKGIRLQNLSSFSEQSLYKYSPQDEPILRWLRSRGVYLEKGDSQLLVATIPSSEEEREKLNRLFLARCTKMKRWDHFRREIIQRFEEETENE